MTEGNYRDNNALAHSNLDTSFGVPKQTGTKSSAELQAKRTKELEAKRKISAKQGGFYAKQFAKKGGSQTKIIALFGGILGMVLLMQGLGGASKPYPRKKAGEAEKPHSID
jgi:hypothetical protein